MSLLATLIDELATAGLRLRKAQPRGTGRLTMELDGPDGRLCAGQWHADASETQRVATMLRSRFGGESVDVLARGHLLVQRAGADRKLPVLRRVVAAPGARLVAHRPERRAVVRLGDGRYVKVVRPGQTGDVVAALSVVRPGELRVPRVLGADDRRGLVTLSEVPGPTLLERLADDAVGDGELTADAKRVGVAVRTLHAQVVTTPHAIHDRDAEIAAARRWLDAAGTHGLLDPETWRGRLDEVAGMLSDGPAELAFLHRDLHDKQVVLQPGEPVGLLDLDLATYGDPALDLANLLAHLDLRARQGICTERRAARCSAALLEGYSPGEALLRRLPGYSGATRLRLAGIYSFRDARAGLVEELICDLNGVESRWL